MPSTTASPDATGDDAGTLDRVASLVSNYGLHVELVLATAATVLSPIAVFVFFVGIFAAMPMGSSGSGDAGGADPVLLAALVLVAVAGLSVVVLALSILVRAPVDAYVRTDGFQRANPLETRPVRSVVYGGIRSTATLSAAVVLGGGVAGLVLGNPWGGGGTTASTAFFVAALGAVGMVVSVYADVLFQFFSRAIDDEDSTEGRPETAPDG